MDAEYQQKTIRDSLLGMVTDHLRKGAIDCGPTCDVGCELVALLAAYREEERRLYPQVCLVGPHELDILRSLAPGIVPPLVIGKIEAREPRRVASSALKHCATLATESWRVFIRRIGTDYEYGLFCADGESYSTDLENNLAVSGYPAALLRHSAENTVEIINSSKGRLEISLTTASPTTSTLSSRVSDFARAACFDVAEPSREAASLYLAQFLAGALRGSHGALLAVTPAKKPLNRTYFGDGILLAEPVPLIQARLDAAETKKVGESARLRSMESLVRGMIESDGVTIFGTDGTVQAFRVFVQKKGRGSTVSSGGARSRAYEVLRGHVGKALAAALFRSQDGRTESEVGR